MLTNRSKKMEKVAPGPNLLSATRSHQSPPAAAPHENRGLSTPPIFDGCNLPDLDDRNIAVLKYLDSLFAYQRKKDGVSICSKLMLYAFFPLGVILVILRLFVFLPITGIFASIICIPRCLQTYILRFELFLFFGFWITVKGRPKKEAKIWVSNHISEIDALCLRAIDDPHILGYSFYATLWWLKCSPLSIMKLVYVQQQSRTEGNAEARNEINDKIKAIIAEDENNKILVFPEGGLTNTNSGILQFHKFMFGLGETIQPIVLSNSTPCPLHLDTGIASFFSNVVTFFFTPFQRYTVEFLDAKTINVEAGEDALDFARRTAQDIADRLKVPSTPFLYSDKRKWLKLRAKLVEDGYDFEITINEQSNTIGIINRMKRISTLPASAVAPADISNNTSSDKSNSDFSANRQVLLKNIYETWGLANAGTEHMAFKRGNFAI